MMEGAGFSEALFAAYIRNVFLFAVNVMVLSVAQATAYSFRQ
jgi:hypothetical protein